MFKLIFGSGSIVTSIFLKSGKNSAKLLYNSGILSGFNASSLNLLSSVVKWSFILLFSILWFQIFCFNSLKNVLSKKEFVFSKVLLPKKLIGYLISLGSMKLLFSNSSSILAFMLVIKVSILAFVLYVTANILQYPLIISLCSSSSFSANSSELISPCIFSHFSLEGLLSKIDFNPSGCIVIL